MKKTFLLFNFAFLIFNSAFPQAGEWVWIKGDSVPNQPGNYGVQGVPSPTNNPPSLYEPCEWTDLNGNFWLFGGLDNSGNVFGDLWKYDPLTNEWTWVKGPGVPNDSGSYGAQGVPSPGNMPPSKGWGIPSWIDNQGDLWLFGGGISGGSATNDLWKYNITTNEWTWMKGANTTGQAGVYGSLGVPSPGNTPGARMECSTGWTDAANNLWLFGGLNISSTFNDLWSYNVLTNEWTWMKGSSLANQPGNYGMIGTEDSLNVPGARMSHCRWRDSTGKFWMHGGASVGNVYNDLWRYNPATNNWAWMSGSNIPGSSGSYGTMCMDSLTNEPQSRFENRAAWTNQAGDLLLFGGWANANDLWKYCVSASEWVWISGDSTYSITGNWGILGTSAPNNKPNSRGGAIGWTDNNNHLFLYGGALNPSALYNDIWKYTIDTTCGVCLISTGIGDNNPPEADQLLVFPNPANSSFTVSFQSSQKQNIYLRIYNTLGKLVYFSEKEILKRKFEKEINVENLSSGIYFLQLKTKDENINKKVIVNH